MEVSFEEEVDGDQAYNLTGLQAFAAYVVALRCVAQESKFWSGWSQEAMGMTEEEGKWALAIPFCWCWVRVAGPPFVGFAKCGAWELGAHGPGARGPAPSCQAGPTSPTGEPAASGGASSGGSFLSRGQKFRFFIKL